MKREVFGKMMLFTILAGCTILVSFASGQPGAAHKKHIDDLFNIFQPMIATTPGLPDQRAPVSKQPKAPLLYSFKAIDIQGSINTFPSGINKSGEIVGAYFDVEAFQHAFVLTDQGVTIFDFPGAINSGLFGINKAGYILGGFVHSSGATNVLLNKALDEYWPIIFPNVYSAQPFGLNDSAQIVGRFFASRDEVDPGILHAFLLDRGQFNAIDFPQAHWTEARGINNFGQIVGNYGRLSYGRDSHGFIFNVWNRKKGHASRDENFTPIDVPGADGTIVTAINDHGQVVGGYRTGFVGHGFLFSNGTFYTLDFPGASSTTLWSINHFGEIVGQFSDANGIHGFYADPK